MYENQWLGIETVFSIIFYRKSPQNMPDFDNVRPLATTEIISRDSKLKLEVSHDFPALLGEWYPIRMILENKENHRITGVSANVNLQTSGDEPNIEQSSKLSYWVLSVSMENLLDREATFSC
jgi:hypothetical protein